MASYAVGRNLTQAQVDELFQFNQSMSATSNSYFGRWESNTTFIIIYLDTVIVSPTPTIGNLTIRVNQSAVIRAVPFSAPASPAPFLVGGTFQGSCATVPPPFCAAIHRDPCTTILNTCGNCSAGWYGTPNSNLTDCQVVYTSLVQGSSVLATGKYIVLYIQVAVGAQQVTGDSIQLRDAGSGCGNLVSGTLLVYNNSLNSWTQDIYGDQSFLGFPNQLIVFGNLDGSSRTYRICQRRHDVNYWQAPSVDLQLTVVGGNLIILHLNEVCLV